MAWTQPQLFLDEEPEVIAPEPPTWRVFLSSTVDAEDYTASEIKLRLEQIGFEPSQLDEEMDESWWEMHYDRISGPSAKAYRLLERIDLGPDLGRRGDGPHLQFREGGGNPFDYSLHAHASDMLALSLLQARLIDLHLPIKVENPSAGASHQHQIDATSIKLTPADISAALPWAAA